MKVRALLFIILLSLSSTAMAMEWQDFWFTPDQQGQRLMQKGEYLAAADKFSDPGRIGTALFLGGDFKRAATVLGRASTAEASYNRGNAHVMLGEYDAAIEAYQNAIALQPEFPQAQNNLEIARLRRDAIATPDDDFGGTGGKLEADEIVFDQKGGASNSSEEQVIDAADQVTNESEMRAIWLRKVETRPADFLAVRFNYQLAKREQEQDTDVEEPEEQE